jgi:predicted esterase
VLERGMPRFFRRLAEGVFDLEDLRLRTAELGEFVRAATRDYGLDPDQIFAVGFSNGANIAASLLLTEPALLRGAALFRAMVPFEPIRAGGLEGKRILLSEGRVDPIVPLANAERLAALLRLAGAEVTLDWRPGGHRLETEDVEAARRWLNPSA